MNAAQIVFSWDILGGWRPGLLAQRSSWSMIFWWLGRRGFGASGSSESLRGSVTVSVMASSVISNMIRHNAEIKRLSYCFYLSILLN
jgi:hypothetical protein